MRFVCTIMLMHRCKSKYACLLTKSLYCAKISHPKVCACVACKVCSLLVCEHRLHSLVIQLLTALFLNP